MNKAWLSFIVVSLLGMAAWGAMGAETEIPCPDARDQWKVRWEIQARHNDVLEAQLAAVAVQNNKLLARISELEKGAK